jgi:hypothetical protein
LADETRYRAIADKISSCQAIASYSQALPNEQKQAAVVWAGAKQRMLTYSRNLRKKRFEEDREFVREGENGRGSVHYG